MLNVALPGSTPKLLNVRQEGLAGQTTNRFESEALWTDAELSRAFLYPSACPQLSQLKPRHADHYQADTDGEVLRMKG